MGATIQPLSEVPVPEILGGKLKVPTDFSEPLKTDVKSEPPKPKPIKNLSSPGPKPPDLPYIPPSMDESPRKILSHVVHGDPQPQVSITVLDAKGPGNAHHHYCLQWSQLTNGILPVTPRQVELHFQNGPIKSNGINGITNESLLAVVIDRLEGFQSGPFASPFNAQAVDACKLALEKLRSRTVDRITRGVEGESVK